MDKNTLLSYGNDSVEIDTSAGPLKLRQMDGAARDTFVNAAIKADESKDVTGLQALLVHLTLLNGDNSLMFDTPEEANRLNGQLLKEIADAAQELNALTDESPKD